jgi:hypothetical protein
MTGDKRSRGDDSRGNHRDRERGAGKDTDRFAESSRGDQRSEKEEVSKTVIVKGLTAHTTEPAVRLLFTSQTNLLHNCTI